MSAVQRHMDRPRNVQQSVTDGAHTAWTAYLQHLTVCTAECYKLPADGATDRCTEGAALYADYRTGLDAS